MTAPYRNLTERRVREALGASDAAFRAGAYQPDALYGWLEAVGLTAAEVMPQETFPASGGTWIVRLLTSAGEYFELDGDPASGAVEARRLVAVDHARRQLRVRLAEAQRLLAARAPSGT